MKIEVANTFFKQLKGLMFRRDFDGVMIFPFKKPVNYSFHTFFMFFPIDIYFFYNDVVVEKYLNVKPWKIIKPKHKYNLVVECKAGKYSLDDIKLVFLFLKRV